nr:hypothetical protein [uncultured Mitsuokella sp.]
MGIGTHSCAVLLEGNSPIAIGGGVPSLGLGFCPHSRRIIAKGFGIDPGCQGIISDSTVVQIVVIPGLIRCFRGLDAVVMDHGLFQLGQIHGIAVFTAGGYIRNLAAAVLISHRNGTVAGFPHIRGIDGRLPGPGVPAGNIACPVCRRPHTQGHAAFNTGRRLFANSHRILFGIRVVPDSHGGRFCLRLIANSHGILPVRFDFTAGGDGVTGRLIKGDGIELICIVRFLIIIFQAAISILICLAGIGGNFLLRHRFAGRGIRFRVGMDVLGRRGRIVIGIPEHLRHFCGLASTVLVPGRVVLAGGFISVGIDIIGHRFI